MFTSCLRLVYLTLPLGGKRAPIWGKRRPSPCMCTTRAHERTHVHACIRARTSARVQRGARRHSPVTCSMCMRGAARGAGLRAHVHVHVHYTCARIPRGAVRHSRRGGHDAEHRPTARDRASTHSAAWDATRCRRKTPARLLARLEPKNERGALAPTWALTGGGGERN